MAEVEVVRRRFDPLAADVPAHITVVFPFESDVSTANLERHVREATAGLAPFAVGFGDVAASEDGYMFITLTAGASAVTDLHSRLYTGLLEEFLAADRLFVPHITIGRFAHPGALEAGLHETRSLDFGPGTTVSALTSYRVENQHRSIEFEHSLEMVSL